MNITPNSFSDGGELTTPQSLQERFKAFGPLEALDIGAESTAPMNQSITWEEEWRRLGPFIDVIKSFQLPISIDTYHPETIHLIAEIWKKEQMKVPLIWNDVSGKFDASVNEFLEMSENFQYVFCHNLAPDRQTTGRHMSFVSQNEGEDFLDELVEYFLPFKRPRVIFDPTLGFSKSYEQNWLILERIDKIQKKVDHDQWLLGFSRKSFLRKKLGIQKIDSDTREQLDRYHVELVKVLTNKLQGTVWIRTHRPDLFTP